MREVGNVDPPGRHIRRHEEAQGSVPHPSHDPLPGSLGKVGAQFVRIVPETFEDHRHVVHRRFRVAEDDGRHRVLGLDDANEGAFPLHPRNDVVNMVRSGHMDMIPAQAQEFGLVEELSGKAHHVGGKGRGKHVGADRPGGEKPLDPLHVGIEPHGEHAVGFIEDQDLQLVQRKRSLEQVVEYPSRRPHDQVRAPAECFELGAVFYAAINCRRHHLETAAEKFRIPGHLQGQFAGGHEDEDLAGFLLHIQSLQDRQDECPGLPAPRLRLDHQVPAGKHIGDCPGLDGQELRPSRSGTGGPDPLGEGIQGRFGKGVLRLDDALALCSTRATCFRCGLLRRGVRPVV